MNNKTNDDKQINNLSEIETDFSLRVFDLISARVFKGVYFRLDDNKKKVMEETFSFKDDKAKEEFIKENIPDFEELFKEEAEKLQKELKEEAEKQVLKG